MRRLVRLTTTRWVAGPLALLVLLGAMVGAALLGEADRRPSAADSLPIGSDSAAAAMLRERLPASDGSTAVVLFSRAGQPLSRSDLALVRQRAASLGTAGPPASVVPSRDGTAAVVVVPVDAPDASAAATKVAALRTAARADLPVGLTAQVTGPAAVQADLAAVFAGANTRLLVTTAGVVAILLVVTYRSPILWVVPLVVIGVGDRLAGVLATHALQLLGLAWDESTVGILSVLVFGAGTDYALLLISRYRDELRRTPDRRQAMSRARRRTTEAVLSSAVTVVVGLLTLLLSVVPTTRGLGLACAVGVVVAAFFALVVLPPTLVLLGRWVFWPRVPRVGDAPLADARSPWRRVGRAVAARPGTIVAVSLVALLGVATGVSRVDTGLSTSDQFLTKPEAIAAAERLARSFPAGSADPALVLTTADPQTVLRAVRGSDGVASARLTRQGGGVASIDAVLAGAPSSAQARAAVTGLRTSVAALPGTHVGGTEAAALDQSEATSRDRSVVFPLLLALVLMALVVLLRSLVAPVVLMGTVLLTYVSSLGLSWLLFTTVFDFPRLDDGAPLLAFVFLVALGVDYNIFLVTRAWEESRGHGAREGMLRALAATGGVITSAGVLLAAVFAVLGVLPLVVLAQLGVIVCVGVLLDTLVVRTLIVPAIALQLGDRFWWPRRLPTEAHGGAPAPDRAGEPVAADHTAAR